MLVLCRKPGESIIINDRIRMTVVTIQGNKVRLAFNAPADVLIDRAEIHERRQEFLGVDPEMAPA